MRFTDAEPVLLSIFRVLSFFPTGCRKGSPLPLSSAGGACTPLGNNLSPVCGQCRRRFRFTAAVSLPPGCRKGRRPFPFLPQARACTPLGNNLSPISSQCRQRFRFIAAVSLPLRMPEGAVAPSAFFRRRGRVPRRGAIFCLSGRNDLLSSSISSVPKLLPKENRFRYAKPGARHSRVPGFASLVQRGFILSARLLTGENMPPTRSAAASPSTESWSPRRFPTHNAHRGRSAPRTSCTSRPTVQPSLRQW